MKRRCLVVDDAEDVRLLIGLSLGRAGLEVVAEAENAARALAVAVATKPDIVLVDLTLPDADGLETIADLRGLLPGAMILVCSGLPAPSMAAACRDAGADHYLEKAHLLDIGSLVVALLSDASA